jgi:hypothetical protein
MKYPRIILFSVFHLAAMLIGCDRKKTPRSLEESASPTAIPVTEPKGTPGAASSSEVEDKETRAVREPKRHPNPAIPPRPLNPIGDRLNAALANLHPNKREYSDGIRRLWLEETKKVPVQILESASKIEVARGLILPKEFSSLKLPDLTNDTPEAALIFISFASLATGQDDLLVELAKQRMEELPPTNLDLAIFQALDSSIKEMKQDSIIVQLENWEQLATSVNPIYRVLALRAGWHSTAKKAIGLSKEDPNFNIVNGSAKLDFYISFLDEGDPIILAEAIAAVATVPIPEARQAIEKFQEEQQQRGDVVLVQAAAQALRTQELVAQGSR